MMILGLIYVSSIIDTYLTYYTGWTEMHLLVAGLLCAVLLFVRTCMKDFFPMGKGASARVRFPRSAALGTADDADEFRSSLRRTLRLDGQRRALFPTDAAGHGRKHKGTVGHHHHGVHPAVRHHAPVRLARRGGDEAKRP